MTPSEALCIAETIKLQVQHGYKATGREEALITLAKKVREYNRSENIMLRGEAEMFEDAESDRDLFAMAALQGLLAGPNMIKSEELAKYCYQIADAMIAESIKSIPKDTPEDIEA